MSRIDLVVAVAANGIIGSKGKLPWHLPEDLKHFKRVTLGHPVIMGRRTWESLPGGALPGRKNIVITHQQGYAAPGATVTASLAAALAQCAAEPVVCIIGGERVFAESLPLATRLEMTEIHRDFPGDTSFPKYDRSQWRELKREAHTAKDGMRFDFVLYERKA